MTRLFASWHRHCTAPLRSRLGRYCDAQEHRYRAATARERWHGFSALCSATTRLALISVLAAHAVAQTPTLQEQIAGRLTADALKADVSFLASDALQGRGNPSPGQEIAAEYIAAQFRRAGLEPAGDDSYFQTAPFASVTPSLEGLELTVEIGGNTVKADPKSMALLQAAAADLKQSDAVIAAFQNLQSLTTDQVRGKVLILDVPDGTPMQSVTAVLEHQPVLLILLRSMRPRVSEAPQLRETTSQPPVPVLVVWDTEVRAALAAPAGETRVSAHIAAPKVVGVKLRNVIGVLRGADPQLKDTYVMVTAHYDHLGVRGVAEDRIFNGANDNASGTASIIEIANALSALPARPKRSIVFMALFGEELGLVGSRYYSRHPVFPLAKTVADINLEQMGRTDDTDGPRVGAVSVTGFDYTTLTPILQKAGEDFGVKFEKVEAASDAFYRRSDNQAFADVGVPAHTLSVAYNFPDYHRPGDEWPKLDYDNMAKVARSVALAVLRVADSTETPKWNADNPKTERFVKAHEALVQPAK